MQESSKEFVEYKSFDELPDELKEKFKSGAKNDYLINKAKDGYVGFINQLNQRGNELVGNYVGNKVKTQVRFSECNHVADINPDSHKRGQGCAVCRGLQVKRGVNDLATTHPHYVKYFVNINDTHTYTYSSSKKVKMKCIDCGHTKTMKINTLAHQGFPCSLCSDGVSYPEKLMSSILTKLNIEFTKQMSYDNGEHRYDFYLCDYSAIIETHGRQHYEQTKRKGARTLEEEQENDRYKRELANKNGILNENYHEIDCRYSTLEWCRPNIEQALSNYIDMSILTDEDWKQADIQAQKSLKIEVCKYWNGGKEADNELTVKQVAKVFGITVKTARDYLNWGSANGFCVYDAQEEMKAKIKRESTFVYLIEPNGNKWFENAMGLRELERQTGISRSALKNSLNKGALKYNHSANYPKEFIGSYIVSAELYDSQTQSN